jgi:hypothetical protein
MPVKIPKKNIKKGYGKVVLMNSDNEEKKIFGGSAFLKNVKKVSSILSDSNKKYNLFRGQK